MKTIQLFGLGLLVALGSTTSWSQCAVINCPTDITVNNDSSTCGATVNYNLPLGFNACNSDTITFNYSGTIENWVVPAGVTSVTIEARGAQGSNNTSSTVPAGLGAVMVGNFSVTPGQTLKILVGQQYSSTGGNGGGGGTFVTDIANSPLIVAGGGGGSAQTLDSPDKHGQAGTSGGTGAGGGGLGGTNGNGGNIGASFASGAGGGLLTNGANGWTANSGGLSFLNGGSGGTANSLAQGGFGGGGSGSSYVVGGGGGGYSGGGAGSNSLGAGVGGGGGSYNGGTNQSNTAGVNLGHGSVVISYFESIPVNLVSGLGSGSTFPVGTTTETYVAVIGGDSAFCSFNVIVEDTEAPSIVVPTDVESCDPMVAGISASSSDNCPGDFITYTLTGATTGSGLGDVSGSLFNVGTTTVWYVANDAAGNKDSSSFQVVVHPLPSVSLDTFMNDTMCVYNDAVALPLGNPTSGIYSGSGVVGSTFDPSVSGVGTHWIHYTYTDSLGCANMDSTSVYVDGCAGLEDLTVFKNVQVYPNPGNGELFVVYPASFKDEVECSIFSVNGKQIEAVITPQEAGMTRIDLRAYPDGMYLLEIKVKGETEMVRVVKQ